ncbi:bactofilin family protein [Phenylobacterium sp.]|uniref:bactofilin family protein n=1 Tax=Phenylobacterium sp. TaxID=1871053 RepID=UPI003BA90104
MFSKTAKTPAKPPVKFDAAPAPLAAEPQRKAPRAASLISENITIEGNVTGEGEVHIDGVVRGDVRVGKLTVGETGHIEGGVYAEAIEARGRIIGAVTAKQVRLYGTAYVDGDITHEQLAMETGAFFQGRSLKFQRPATPPTPAPSPLAQAPAPTPGLAPKPV